MSDRRLFTTFLSAITLSVATAALAQSGRSRSRGRASGSAAATDWEREGESQEYFDRFSPKGYALGVNVVLDAMTH